MANNYAITQITHMGDVATVTGTVNGVPVVVTCNWSAITALPNTAAVQAFLAPLMLAQAQPAQPTVVNTFDSAWSQ
jgi:hypothetical protein